MSSGHSRMEPDPLTSSATAHARLPCNRLQCWLCNARGDDTVVLPRVEVCLCVTDIPPDQTCRCREGAAREVCVEPRGPFDHRERLGNGIDGSPHQSDRSEFDAIEAE